MRKTNLITAFTGLAIIAGTAFASSWSLVTEEEFRASAAAGEEELLERATIDPMAPVIEIVQPGEGDRFKAPVDIELAFMPQGDAEIDVSTLKIKYGALGIDVTDRVTEHATLSNAGLMAPAADLPAGKHKLTISIADKEGRVGKRKFKFRIVK